ncbi:MAG TPA: hypothetical protein VGG75_07875 [Trebonia sp.]|jgi:hypothetical protein
MIGSTSPLPHVGCVDHAGREVPLSDVEFARTPGRYLAELRRHRPD